MAGVKFDITGNANGFVSAARQAENAAKNMSKSVTNEGKALDDMFKRLASGMATLGAGLSATALTKEIFNIRSEFQQLEVAFTTMLKSKEKADKLMRDATEFAATTPFDLKGVAAGIKQNLAYGASVDTVIDEMRMLGDVASGIGAPLNDLVYLYGTLRTSGRVATIDIRQFAGRGIPIYEELAKVLGVAKNEVAGLVTAGKVGFADIEQAFKNMTSEGGMFANLMANQSKTLQGQFSNLMDNIDMMFNEIGQKTQGVFADALGLAGKLVENYETVGRALSVLVATYGTYKAAVIAVAAAQKVQVATDTIKHFLELTKVMKTAAAAQQAFNDAAIANPYILAAAALAALVAGVVAYTKHKKAEVEAQRTASREVAKEVNEVNTLAAKLKDANTSECERIKALERLKEIAPEVVDGIDSEKDSLDKLNTQLEEYSTLKSVEIALKASTQYIDFSESIQSLNDAKAEMEEKKGEIINVWTDLSAKITAAIKSGDVSQELADYFESFLYDPNVDFAEKIQKVRNAEVQSGINFSRNDDNFLREIFFDTRKDIVDYSTALNNLTVLETNYTNAVEQLRKRIHDSINLVYADAKEAEKAEKTLLVAFGLEKAESTPGGGTTDPKEVTAKQREQAYKRKQAEIKAAEDLAKLKKNLNDKVAKADIDSMEDGYAKSLKTLEFNLQQELDAIEQQKKDLLKSKKDEALKSWLAEDPEGRKEYQFVYTPQLSAEEEEIFRKMGAQAQAEFNKGREDLDKQWDKEAEFTTRQFAIDAMYDGASKEAAQRQLDNERELHNLELQRDAYIEAAKAAHILAENEKKLADINYVIEPFDADAANDNFDKIVTETRSRQKESELKAEKDALNEYLSLYGTYQEKRLAIAELYSSKIADANTGGEKKTLIAQRDKELSSIDFEVFKESGMLSLAFSDLSRLSQEAIGKLIKDLEEYRAEVIETFDASSIKEYEQVLTNLKKIEVENSFGVLAGFIPEWYKQRIADQETLNELERISIDLNEKKNNIKNDIEKTEERILDLIKEQTGVEYNSSDIHKEGFLENILETIKSSKGDTSDIESEISNLSELAVSYNNVSNASGTATKKYESFYDMLKGGKTGVAGTINMIDAIVHGINDLVQGVGGLIDEISSTMDALGKDTGIDNGIGKASAFMDMFGEASQGATDGWDSLKNGDVMGVINGVVKSITAWIKGIAKWKDANKQLAIDDSIERVEELDKAYERLEHQIKDTFSVDTARVLREQKRLLELKKAELLLQIQIEASKKDPDWEKIVDLSEQVDNISYQIVDTIKAIQESIVGISFSDLRSSFVDSLQDMKNDVDDFSKDIEEKIRDGVYDAFFADSAYEDELRKLYAELATAIEKNNFAEIERIKAEIESLYKEAKYDSEIIDRMLGYEADSTRDASAKGFAQASQTSVDELNGRATAIQSHTFSINDRVGSLVNLTSQLLARVINIESHTERLKMIEVHLTYIDRNLSDILTKGVVAR